MGGRLPFWFIEMDREAAAYSNGRRAMRSALEPVMLFKALGGSMECGRDEFLCRFR